MTIFYFLWTQPLRQHPTNLRVQPAGLATVRGHPWTMNSLHTVPQHPPLSGEKSLTVIPHIPVIYFSGSAAAGPPCKFDIHVGRWVSGVRGSMEYGGRALRGSPKGLVVSRPAFCTEDSVANDGQWSCRQEGTLVYYLPR